MDLKVTNIEDLKKVAQGEVIQLPQFSQGIPFNAKVKRVSLLNLVRKGVVPNKLLSAAEELFYGKQSLKENVDLAQMTDVMYIMAENALVEPSIEDLKSVGLELTDEQIVSLFNYTQEGVSELNSFREESENTECNINK
ncbi:esterase [Clostridium sporogenes]|uniref:Esterase n=1 Tax=Clostridium sporogenes TaxID=1509 RepID=A0ABX4K2L6_CLOSG|nr:esterase [Clostridium sporogenes]NFF64492.1 esterase [Clostridium sporogenes]NFH48509.1 esterase [Clostridium sporogenes]PHG99151.1 esterase [Clostridium sporogenes]UBI13706.1 esterase [Clostridium sporogenes]